MEKEKIIEGLMKAVKQDGTLKNELIKGVETKGITVSPQEKYVRLGITTTKPVKAFVANKETGLFELSESNIIFVSLFTICALLRDIKQARFAVDRIQDNPECIKIILDDATFDIIQEYVNANTEYVNPWSTEEKPKIYAHDIIINHVINIKLGEFGLESLKDLAKNMMGIK